MGFSSFSAAQPLFVYQLELHGAELLDQLDSLDQIQVSINRRFSAGFL